MTSEIRKMFSLNTESESFRNLGEKEKVLVESGVEVVKKFVAEKAKVSNKTDVYSALDSNKVESYADYNRKVVEKIVKYSMESAGIPTDNFNIAMVRNPQVNKRTQFRETFNAVLAQIMTPMIPAMASAAYMDMADVSNIALGDTARFVVHSNEAFVVNRIAEGVLDGSVQRLYNGELTVNPEPYNIRTAVDWYQVAAGIFDLGEFVYKVGYSFNAYITQMIVQAIGDYVKAGITASSPYFANSFTTSNFINIAERVRAANGGAHVTGYGALAALAGVIPTGGSANNIGNALLQVGVADEWAKVGHVGRYMDVDLVRIPQILLPGTVNNTALFGIPNNTVYFFADGGYKPVKIVFEGQAVTVDIIPTVAPDKEMGIQVTTRMGQSFVAASKFGAITNITL